MILWPKVYARECFLPIYLRIQKKKKNYVKFIGILNYLYDQVYNMIYIFITIKKAIMINFSFGRTVNVHYYKVI